MPVQWDSWAATPAADKECKRMTKSFKTEKDAIAWANQKVGVCFGTFKDARISLNYLGYDIKVEKKKD